MSIRTCNLSTTAIKRFPPIEVFSGTRCFHFSVPLWKFRVCPHGQGGVAARQSEWEGITQHDYSPSLCLRLCSPDYCPCELTGHWQGIGCSLLSLSDSPAGQPAKRRALPATLSYIPQQSVRCQLAESGWVPPSASLAAPDTWTSTGVEEKKRETGMAGRLRGGSESYVK